MSEYTTTFTSFSGTDVVIFINGIKIIGELQDIKWEINLNDMSLSPISGTMSTVLFERECPLMKYKDESFDALLLYANEWGQSKAEYISGIRLQTMSTGISVDDIVQEANYTFTAREAGIIENFPIFGDDKIQWIREFLDGKDIENLSNKDKKTLQIVQQHLLHQIIDRGWELIHKSDLYELKLTPQERLTHNFEKQLRQKKYEQGYAL